MSILVSETSAAWGAEFGAPNLTVQEYSGRCFNFRECIYNVPGKPYSVTWGIAAPWAHPVWSQYCGTLVDLTTPTEQPPIRHFAEATHEFLLYAVTPETPIPEDLDRRKFHLLQTANLGYQFHAEPNEAALLRVRTHIQSVADGMLSPDTDWRAQWHLRFHDGYSLLRSGL